MKKALSNTKIITMLIVAILMISAFAMGNLSLNNYAMAEQRYSVIADDNFDSLDDQTWTVSGDGVSVDGSLKIENGTKGDKIFSKKLAVEDTSIISNMTVLSVKFNAKWKDGTPRFAFGLAEDGSITEDTFIVQFGSYRTYKCAARIFDVKADLSEEIITAIPFNSIDKGSDIEIRVNKDHTLSIIENGTELTPINPIDKETGIDNYAGACGFIVASRYDSMIIDDLTITSINYHVPTSKSVSTNFNDDYHGKPLSNDFVLKAEDADKFGVVDKPLRQGEKTADGALEYAGSSVNDYIASSYEYDAFIVDFKISGISAKTAESAWIGVDFGRTAKDSVNGENAIVAIKLVSGEVLFNGEVVGQVPAELLENATYAESGNVNDIDKADVINVRLVAKDSTISLYVKSMGDLDYACYAIVSNVKVAGYVAIVSSGDVYMMLDDLAITNQSPVYNVPTNEAAEKVYIIIPAPSDYNKYRDNPEDLKEELNYLNGLPGSGSSIVSAIVIPSAILMCVALAAIVVKKAKKTH